MKDAWYPVARIGDFGKHPLPIEFFSRKYVLFRDKEEIAVLPNACPHRGFSLSKGKVCSGAIRCPYHGWAFDLKGRLQSLPGKVDFIAKDSPVLEPPPFRVQSGFIWLYQGENPEEHKPYVSRFDLETRYYTGQDQLHSKAVDILENFLDPLHTHFVHPWLIRSANNERHLCKIDIENTKDGYQASYYEESQQTGLLSKLFGGSIAYSVGRISYPGVAEIEYYSTKGIELAVVVYIHPIKDERHRVFIRAYYKKNWLPLWLKAIFMYPFQWLTYQQDKKILEHLFFCKPDNFEPVLATSDVMRLHIENVLNGEISETKERKKLML